MKTPIRQAEEKDYTAVAELVAQIHALHVRERPDIYSPDPCPMGKPYYDQLLAAEHSRIFVAEAAESGSVVAYAVIHINQAPRRKIFRSRKYVAVDDLCVDEAWRGRGIGRAMMEHLTAYAKRIGADCIELGVSEFNQEAIRFYEGLGMTVRSRRMELRIAAPEQE